ncbi:LemA family protein [Candidatus Uhrbacteria bacterium]|nr:LemA family protein [Candidatus Uhrbacteria bacterium]
MPVIFILFLLPVILIAWIIVLYNGLIQGRNRVDEAWSDIDVQLKRRYDLIPNVVETVRGYAKHEEGVFTKVTEARTAAMSATTPAQHGAAENMLSGALKSLFAVAEAYPQLQAAGNFLNLQQQLGDTEDKIQASRRFYNANVRDFNTKIQAFPANLLANAMGFMKREFFDAPDTAMEVPQVKF